ncbi:magnesium transporter 10 [Perilla frutescens var. frutescens]|nr:magnesium transporter 10 [Perilla frutescens var. frutescens]
MASPTPLSSQSSPNLMQLPLHFPQFRLILAGISLSRSKQDFSRKLLLMQQPQPQRSWDPLRHDGAKEVVLKCFAEPTEERESAVESVLDKDGGDEVSDEEVIGQDFPNGAAASQRIPAAVDSISLGIREPVYEVVEVRSSGVVSTRKINRRHLLKSSGLRPRDVRSVDPSLWLTNTMPSLLVREYAILLNLGSLRAIAMQECVYIFNYNRRAGKAFIDTLLPRLNPKNINGGPSMPFVLEVVEAALQSRIQRLEQRLMDLEPRIQALLEVLPNRLTANILEELRISKQTLVELGSKAGALKQMLLDILEDTHEIRRICIMGRNCTLAKNDEMECSVPLEKEIAEEEEEEIEMLLENYLQRCESCHGHAERLLDSAKEMEDSIAVNLSSRRLEVSRVELLLQVGAFCVAVGALIAGYQLKFLVEILTKVLYIRIYNIKKNILKVFIKHIDMHANYMISSCKILVLPVCLLANNGRDFRGRCAWILSHVCIPQEKENFVRMPALVIPS